MASSIQTRADLIFQFDDQGLGGTHISYHMNDFLVRVEKVAGESHDPENEVRYGVMVELEGDDSYWKKSYIMEIPVKASTSKGRKQAQEVLIKQYIDEMRDKFQTFFAEETKAGTIDEFNKMELQLNSADGRWNISRKFRNHHLISFVDWLFNIKVDKKEDLTEHLIRSRMAFETDKKYLVTVDWAAPYITFTDAKKVSHFETGAYSGRGSSSEYYPFHNFVLFNQELCTEINVERDRDYASEYEIYQRGIEIKPSHYALFAFYSHVIDEICRLQQENFDALKPYYVYVQNLSLIQERIEKGSPIEKMSEQEISTLLTKEIIEDWDGDTSDHENKDHLAHLVLGIRDIISAKELFGDIIREESVSGRNSHRSVNIQMLAKCLKTAFLQNAVAKLNHEDLWGHNHDDYGVNHVKHKMLLILAQMPDAKDTYEEFVKANLFEHSVLEDSSKGKNDINMQPVEWSNMLYRSNNILWDVAMAFYAVREEALKFQKVTSFKAEISSSTKPPNAVGDWVLKKVVEPDAVAGKSTPSQLYNEWKLGDVQVRKLANYLLGGGQIENLKSVERQFAQSIKEIMGNEWFKGLPFEKFNLIHDKLLDVKLGLMEEIPAVRMELAQNGANIASSAINLLLAKVTYDNAYKKGASFESKLRAHTLAIGVFSDVANTVAKFKGIEATLARSAAQKAGGRLAFGLGVVQFVGGGVGGILGAVWFTSDSGRSFNKGFGKDGVLDLVSAGGCLLGAIGLAFDTTIIGLPVGVVCSIVSFTLVMTAQALKYSRVFNSKTEDFCKYMNGESIENGGMDRFSTWKNEFENDEMVLPSGLVTLDERGDVVSLINRVEEFIVNWDTYDIVKDACVDESEGEGRCVDEG